MLTKFSRKIEQLQLSLKRMLSSRINVMVINSVVDLKSKNTALRVKYWCTYILFAYCTCENANTHGKCPWG